MVVNGDDDARALATLRRVSEAGGTLEPRWNPASACGYEYAVAGRALEDVDSAELRSLAERGYLERAFVDRLATCPGCSSFHLNFREVCPTCKSADLDSVELLHHFRCGHVAPATDFRFDGEARRCPKCHGRVRDRGTDHDLPGPHFSCRGCGVSFQMPEVGVVCLACTHRIDAEALSTLAYDRVDAYRLTSLGRAALAEGRLRSIAEPLGFMEPYLSGVYRQPVLLAFVDDEERRRRRFGTPFALLLLDARPSLNLEDERHVIARVRELLDDTDKLGRYEHGSFIVLLPGRDARHAKRLAKRLSGDSALSARALRATPVEADDGARVAQALAGSMRALERHA